MYKKKVRLTFNLIKVKNILNKKVVIILIDHILIRLIFLMPLLRLMLCKFYLKAHP